MPGGDLLTNAGRVLIASEGTYATDAIDLANNLAVVRRYLPVREFPAITPIHDFAATTRVRGSASSEGHVHIPAGTAVTIVTPLPGAVAVGTTEYPDIAPLLKCCGMSETLVSSTSATYKDSTTQGAGVSMYAYRRSTQSYKFRLHPAFGLRGNMVLAGALRDEATCTFSLESPTYRITSGNTVDYDFVSDEAAFFDSSGLIDLDIDGNSIIYTGGESYADPPKPVVSSITFTIDSVAFQAVSFEINQNRTIKRLESVQGATTIAEVLSLKGSPTLSVTFESSGADFEKVLAMTTADSEVAVSIVLSLGSGNDQITISMPKVQSAGYTESDSGGTRAYTTTFVSRGDYGSSILGDNDLQIVWAQA